MKIKIIVMDRQVGYFKEKYLEKFNLIYKKENILKEQVVDNIEELKTYISLFEMTIAEGMYFFDENNNLLLPDDLVKLGILNYAPHHLDSSVMCYSYTFKFSDYV